MQKEARDRGEGEKFQRRLRKQLPEGRKRNGIGEETAQKNVRTSGVCQDHRWGKRGEKRKEEAPHH